MVAPESPEEIARDVYAISRINAVPALLDVLCEITGMGFAAVARVSNASWTVCAVNDRMNLGLKLGDQLPLETTLCLESKRTGEPIVIDRVSRDPRYSDHPTLNTYQIESYISVPISLPSGLYFGNLCAVDRSPAMVSAPAIVKAFKHFASLIAFQLASEDVIGRTDRSLRAQRDASQARDALIADMGETLLGPVQAISDASDKIDSEANDSSAVRRLATRIRTNALKISSVLERLLDVSHAEAASGLQPDLPSKASPTAKVSPDSLVRGQRDALESLLMHRVGELRSHLGRYDMYALAVARWIEHKGRDDSSIVSLTISTRGTWISDHLRMLAVPQKTRAEFIAINQQLLSVLGRQEIAARNTVSIPSLRAPGLQLRSAAGTRDWFDHLGASNKEVSEAIDAIDRDIVLVAALYIRLAGWAGSLSRCLGG